MNNCCDDVSVTNINPHNLSATDFSQIQEVTQDMWAYGLWEFIKCNECWEIQWKQEIFGKLSNEINENTVADIMRILGIKDIPCPFCWWSTNFIYWEENESAIRERLTQSDAYIAICRNQVGRIVGYMDMYIDSFDTIFRRELASHYKLIGIDEVRDRAEKILWSPTPNMVSFSAMWMLKQYMSMYLVFKLWNTLATSEIPSKYFRMPWITELDRNNNLSSLYSMMWSMSLELNNDVDFKGKITNTWKSYVSDVVVFSKPITDFREKFNIWTREFLRAYSRDRKKQNTWKNLIYA